MAKPTPPPPQKKSKIAKQKQNQKKRTGLGDVRGPLGPPHLNLKPKPPKNKNPPPKNSDQIHNTKTPENIKTTKHKNTQTPHNQPPQTKTPTKYTTQELQKNQLKPQNTKTHKHHTTNHPKPNMQQESKLKNTFLLVQQNPIFPKNTLSPQEMIYWFSLVLAETPISVVLSV